METLNKQVCTRHTRIHNKTLYKSSSHIISGKILTSWGGVNFKPRGIIWTTLVLWPRDLLIQQIRTIWPQAPFLLSLVKFTLVVQEKMSFELFDPQGQNLNNFCFLTPWPTNATNHNHSTPRHHSSWVWSNSHYWCKRRCRLNFSLYKPM